MVLSTLNWQGLSPSLTLLIALLGPCVCLCRQWRVFLYSVINPLLVTGSRAIPLVFHAPTIACTLSRTATQYQQQQPAYGQSAYLGSRNLTAAMLAATAVVVLTAVLGGLDPTDN